MAGTVYLLPNSIGNEEPDGYLPPATKKKITELKFLIVENIRTARRYLKMLNREISIDEISFFELNKHTDPSVLPDFLTPAQEGNDIGILSEAGLPGIADPGALIVALAHHLNIRVVPLTGPSSIFLALMASGLNGQRFRFAGYLPIRAQERIHAIRQLEHDAIRYDETQVFIETPYRNNQLLGDLLSHCDAGTRITIAAEISTENEFIKTARVSEWKKKKPDLHKRPAVFLIGK